MDTPLPGEPPILKPALALESVADINADSLFELERFAEIGRISAGWLHEISHPLTAALLWLEQCGQLDSPSLRRVRSSIRLLQRYVEAARQQVQRESNHHIFSVQPELDQVRHILSPLARRRGVRLQFSPGGGAKLYGDPVKFQQIVANLVRNAIDAYGSADSMTPLALQTRYKPVQVRLERQQHYLMLEVNDQGCGITPAQMSQLFQPFYSTKRAAGSGLGLGLCVVKRHVEADFQGSIRVKSSPTNGTRFTVKLRLTPKK